MIFVHLLHFAVGVFVHVFAHALVLTNIATARYCCSTDVFTLFYDYILLFLCCCSLSSYIYHTIVHLLLWCVTICWLPLPAVVGTFTFTLFYRLQNKKKNKNITDCCFVRVGAYRVVQSVVHVEYTLQYMIGAIFAVHVGSYDFTAARAATCTFVRRGADTAARAAGYPTRPFVAFLRLFLVTLLRWWLRLPTVRCRCCRTVDPLILPPPPYTVLQLFGCCRTMNNEPWLRTVEFVLDYCRCYRCGFARGAVRSMSVGWFVLYKTIGTFRTLLHLFTSLRLPDRGRWSVHAVPFCTFLYSVVGTRPLCCSTLSLLVHIPRYVTFWYIFESFWYTDFCTVGFCTVGDVLVLVLVHWYMIVEYRSFAVFCTSTYIRRWFLYMVHWILFVALFVIGGTFTVVLFLFLHSVEPVDLLLNRYIFYSDLLLLLTWFFFLYTCRYIFGTFLYTRCTWRPVHVVVHGGDPYIDVVPVQIFDFGGRYLTVEPDLWFVVERCSSGGTRCSFVHEF